MKHEIVDNDQPYAESGSSGPPIKLISLLIGIALLAIFFLQNGGDTELKFLWMDTTTRTWVVIGISVLAGIALDRLGSWWWRRARRDG